MIAAVVLAVASGAAADKSNERTLAELVEQHPARARFVAYGTDRDGAPLWALRIGDAADSERPSVTVLPALDEDVDASLLISLASALCAADDTGCDYWLISDPAPAGCGSELATDFPAGWQPPAGVRGAFPLSAPESRALAEHLSFRRRAVALVELRAAAAPAEDGGTLARFAREQLDLPALVLPLSEGGVHLAARLARIAQGRARLNVRESVVRRLAADLWEVECTIANTGHMAAAPAHRRPAHPDRRVTLRCRGPELVAGAIEHGEGFRPLPRDARLWDLGPLPGGHGTRVRFVVRGAPGELLTLEVDAARAHGARAAVRLVLAPH